MMSGYDCPCRTCTPETGRAPGCHTKDCPNGWYEWDQKHQKDRAAMHRAASRHKQADGVLVAAAIKKRGRER